MAEKTVNPRYAGLRPNPQALGVVELAEGEGTRTMRVRAAADVIAWASALSATERGLILSDAFTARHTPQKAKAPEQPRAATDSTPRHLHILGTEKPQDATGKPAQGGQGRESAPTPGKATRPAQEQGGKLTGRSLETMNALHQGGTLYTDGRHYRLEVPGKPATRVQGVTGASLTMKGLIVETEPGVWQAKKPASK